MTDNIIYLKDYRQKQKTRVTETPEDDFKERMVRIRESLRRINNKMSEFRELTKGDRRV